MSENARPDLCAARPALGPQVLALLLVVAVCYANSLDGAFLLDDPRPDVALDYRLRPLVWATFDLNRALGGDAPWGFHVLNALVHAACGLLLLGVLRRAAALVAPGLGDRTRARLAFATTLLWLVHPLQTGSVTYLSQRAESLGALCYLAVLYAFLRAATAARPRGWQVLALVALALGFASKETIATVPVVVWLFDALFLAPGPLAALRLRRGFYGALALSTLVLALVFVLPPLLAEENAMGLRYRAVGPLEYARTQPGVILHYLRLVFWPHPLCFDPGWPIARAPLEWLPQTAVIAALLGATLVLCLRRAWIGFAGACFFLVLAPTSSFVPIQDPAFEHRMYLPLAAVLAPVVTGAWWLLRSRPGARRALPLLAGATALVLAALTVRRNQDYRSAVRLMERTVACAPHHTRARINLGEALLREGRAEEAIDVLNEALRRDPDNGFVYENLGTAYMALGEVERAIPWLERATESVADARFHEALGRALFLKGDHAASLVQFEAALALDPASAFVHCRLAFALGQLGRAQEALQHYRTALELEPELQEARIQLAAQLLALGQVEEALRQALLAREIAPDSVDELLVLGQALRAGGRRAEAVQALQEAARLAPQRPEPRAALAELAGGAQGTDAPPPARAGDPAGTLARLRENAARNPQDAGLRVQLALALTAAGEKEEALRQYEEALRLAPERQEAHINLAALLTEQGRAQEALEHSLAALEILPNPVEEHFNLAQAQRALGRLAEAMAGFLEVVRLAPDRPEAYAAYARTVCAKADASADERREALRMALKANELTHATRPDLLEVSALAHAALGDFASAARLVEQALALPGPAQNPVFAQRLRAQREDYLRKAAE